MVLNGPIVKYRPFLAQCEGQREFNWYSGFARIVTDHRVQSMRCVQIGMKSIKNVIRENAARPMTPTANFENVPD